MRLGGSHSDDVHLHVHVHLGADEGRLSAVEGAAVAITGDLTALTAVVTEFKEDIQAKLDALGAANGNFTGEQQAAFDDLKAAVQSGVDLVGDADEDGNPP